MKQTNDTKDENAKKAAETGENYGFIKEERVPLGKWQKRRKYLRNALIVVAVAALFGVIARCSYGISDYVIRHFFTDDPKEPVTLRPSPSVKVNPGGEVIPDIDLKALESYEKIVQGVQDAVESLDPCMARISYVSRIKDPVFADVTESVVDTSGVIIAENGEAYLILAQYDVYNETRHDNIMVTFYGGKKAEAKVFRKAPEEGLVLFAVKHKDFSAADKNLIRTVPFGRSSELTLGSAIIAIGFPNGHSPSVNMGMVSSRAEKVYVPDNALEIIDTNMFGGRGESGILVNSSGKFVGFITNRYHNGGQSIQALSIDKFEELLRLLANDMAYPRFGAVFRDINDEVLSQMSLQNGIIIDEIVEGSPAAQQGFRKGDIIVKLDGNPVTAVEEFFAIYSRYTRGEDVEATFYRNGKEMKKKWTVSLTY